MLYVHAVVIEKKKNLPWKVVIRLVSNGIVKGKIEIHFSMSSNN